MMKQWINLLVVSLLLALAWSGCSKQKTVDEYLQDGRGYLEQGDHAKAIPALEKALEQNTELAEAHRLIAEALKEGGRWDEALEHLEVYRTLAQNDPAALLLLGEAYAQTGDLMKAAEAFAEGVRLDPALLENHPEEMAAVADTMIQAGKEALESGDLATATDLFNMVAPLAQGQGEVYIALGQAQQKAGDHMQALSAYANAVASSPGLAAEYASEIDALAKQVLEQAEAALDARDFNGSVESLQAVIRLLPDDSKARFLLGNVYNETNQLAQAIEQYEAVLSMEPDNASALTNLGVVYYKMGNLEQAIQKYEAALGVEPDDAETHYLLGAAHVQMGRLEEAKAEFDRSIELDNELAPPYIGLGNIYLMQGDLEAAGQALERAIALSPNSPEAYFALGQLYLQQGKIEEARAALEQVLSLNPEPHWRQQVEQMLESLDTQ